MGRPDPLDLLWAILALEAPRRPPPGTPKPELRTSCSPEGRSPIGKHKHKCPKCETIWEHEDTIVFLCTDEENREAHTCPTCKEEVWDKHLPSIGF